MSYKRFFREAEPYKISKCDNCTSRLRRSAKVYPYLLLMIVVLCLIILPLFFTLVKAQTSLWIIYPIIIMITGAWTVLINYLAWRFIGWVFVPEEKKS